MARFVFELEAVLEQRLTVERDRKLAVARLETQRLAVEDQIRACQRRIVEEKNELRDHLHGADVVDVRSVRLQANSSLHLIAQAQQLVLRLAGVHKRIDEARIELLRASIDRKAVEALRERRYQAWKLEQDRRENAAVDEINVKRAARREDAA